MKFQHSKIMETALLFLMICCYRYENAILIYFLLGEGIKALIFTIYVKAFFISRKTLLVITLPFFLIKQTLRDIILLFNNTAGVDMNLKEWNQFCRKAWENDFDCLQIDRVAEKGKGRYTIRNCDKIT